LNGITSVPNFMKIYQAVQKLLVGDTQTDTHRDLISLLSFLESVLKFLGEEIFFVDKNPRNRLIVSTFSSYGSWPSEVSEN
jgi:hypothetical protein